MLSAPWLAVVVAGVLAGVALVVQRLSKAPGVPLSSAGSLVAAARRTSLVRITLILVLAAAIAVVATMQREDDGRPSGLLPAGKTTIVVLDMSASVSDLVFSQIARSLEAIVDAANESSPPATMGLVLFSDVAQEALPPGTPVTELEPFIRFFRPREERSTKPRPALYRGGAGLGGAPLTVYPLSPWFVSFSAGTRISTGLELARTTLERNSVRDGRVLLISDLDNRDEDFFSLTRELVTYAGDDVRLDVVAVPPAEERQKEVFREILGDDAVLDSTVIAGPGGSERPQATGTIPVLPLAMVALIGVVLALHEFLLVPLRWRTTGPQT